jgi:hypothetical protein
MSGPEQHEIMLDCNQLGELRAAEGHLSEGYPPQDSPDGEEEVISGEPGGS